MERAPHPLPSSAIVRLAAAAIAAAALSAPAAEADFVTVFGDGLRAGDRPAAFVCAAGVRIPEPDPAAGTNAVPEARAAARALARGLALAGFGMARLPDLAVPRPGDPAAEARLAVQDEFVAACKDEGLRVWAEVLHPVLDFVPSPADADALDDPATREAWRDAVADTNFPAASILLAAPWDPRVEILVQRRMRDWARAFNPATGLRRCDDSVYALFSFSTLWWDDLDAASLPELHPFFERGLSDAWNDWLYERFGTDLAARDRFPLDPGETLASNTVAFPPPERAPDSARAREQRTFLHRLSTDHLSRLLSQFSAFGQASRTAPRLVRHGSHDPYLKRFSSIALLEPVRGAAEPDPSLPLVFEASRVRDPAHGLAAAAKAAAAGADVLVLPAGDDPAAWTPAAAAFLAARGDTAALAAAAHDGAAAYDFPSAAHARLVVPAEGETPSVATFPAAGAAIAVELVPDGEKPVLPPEIAATDLPRQFLVCLPPGAAPHSVLDVTFLLPASRPGVCVLLVRSRDGSDAGPFSVLAHGRDLARKECLPGGEPPALPAEAGLFRADGLASPALLLFRPAAPGPGLLRDL